MSASVVRESLPAGAQPSATVAPAALLVSALLWSYPLLWLTGFDGFFWLAILPLLALSTLAQSGRTLAMPPLVATGLALFLVAFLVSGLGVQSAARYLTWARDGLVIVWAILVASLVRSTPRAVAERLFLLPVAMAMVFACGAGLLGALVQEPLELRTLAYHLLPGGIRGTEFAQRQTVKILYQDSWFAGFAYPRVRSFFMYGNNLGQAAAGFLLVFAAGRLWRMRLFYVLAAVLALLVLPLTTSRSAFLGLIVGLGVLVVLRGNGVLRLLIFLSGLAVGLWIVANWAYIEAAADAFSSLRGGGSRNARLQIYSQTFEAILQNPLGHGTQRDVMNLDFPLGSHSSVFGVLYKFGVLGGLGLAMAIAGLCLRYPSARLQVPTSTLVLASGLAVFAVFEELYLDVTVATMLAVYTGFLSSSAGPRPARGPALPGEAEAQPSGRRPVSSDPAFRGSDRSGGSVPTTPDRGDGPIH